MTIPISSAASSTSFFASEKMNAKTESLAKAQNSAKELESILWQQFLEPALKPTGFSDVLSKNTAENDIYYSFVASAVSKEISKAHPMGFDSLLAAKLNSKTTDNN